MSERILLKLGGSVITDKSGDCRIRHEVIESVAGEIVKRRNSGIVIVHGAGSCGHPEASRYRLTGGVTKENLEGVYLTHASVRRLNEAVVAALRRAGLEAIGVHPLSAWLADNGELSGGEYVHLDLMLALGIVPVLHGDVVMDRVLGASVVSGDQLVRRLAHPLRIGRIGLATDVPGLLRDGVVVPLVTPDSPLPHPGGSKNVDVTGGMEGKIRELVALARTGIGSDIFNISRVGDFLDGRPHGGTSVRGSGF
ncbi:MAG: isopentenyl phosphate kinase family protein [Methanoregulaceae archaeon]|nr:isopentenyl phosphate kinase family protein [Methanoregulaceae archaeon]